MGDKLGLYLHIPFCRSKCAYCDFYSLAGREEQMDAYQNALLAHLKQTACTAHCPVDTVYFGGGTPSLFGEKRLLALLAAVKKYYKLDRDAEITLEANPDSVSLKMLAKLRAGGFNRLSIGMQSAQDGELQAVGRPHTAEQTVQAVCAARKAKFKNVSLDLIYGLPGQTLESWQATVSQAVALQPQHLSCYGLKVEEHTPLARRVEAGESLPDDDLQADLYLWTVDFLEKSGFRQYEISNFAQNGFESRHNLRYWLTRPYLGFGPGAHSDFAGRRTSCPRDLEAYLTGVQSGSPALEEEQDISLNERAAEYLMLRLRTAAGIEEWEYRRTFFRDFEPLERLLEQYQCRGRAVKTVLGRWRLTPEGFLVSNQLIAGLLARQELEAGGG